MNNLTSTQIVKRLFTAFSRQDEDEFYQFAEEYINLQKRKKHNIVAKELKEALYDHGTKFNIRENRYKTNMPIPRDNDNGFPLFEIKEYYLAWEQLILPDETKHILTQIVDENQASEVLATYNLKPKNKVLFCGEPGTGKTFSAQVLSSVLQLPLIIVRFDAIISSYLGETATNLRKVFDFAENGRWVVLFDEVDVIGKNRDDHHETGEIKRVVNNFLQMLDNFESDSLVIAATNHPHILDPAIWRRFDEVVNFEVPDETSRLQILQLYLKSIKKDEDIDLGLLSKKTERFTPSDLEAMCKEAMKYAIVSGRDVLVEKDLQFAYSRFVDRLEIRQK
jgi:SpoVK/Ycf46/Vps4 family AAA+-type ATPase